MRLPPPTTPFPTRRSSDLRFHTPSALAIDAHGNLYVADTGNHAIRRVAPDGSVTTLAGDGTPGFSDGPAEQARFQDRKSTRLNSSHVRISYAVFCLKKKPQPTGGGGGTTGGTTGETTGGTTGDTSGATTRHTTGVPTFATSVGSTGSTAGWTPGATT